MSNCRGNNNVEADIQLEMTDKPSGNTGKRRNIYAEKSRKVYAGIGHLRCADVIYPLIPPAEQQRKILVAEKKNYPFGKDERGKADIEELANPADNNAKNRSKINEPIE